MNNHFLLQQNALSDIDVLLASSPGMRVQLFTWSVESPDQVSIRDPGFHWDDG